MAEAEDVITDVARYATIYARDLWRRHRPPPAPRVVALLDVSRRLDVLISAVFGRSFPLRAAQPPAPPTFLSKVFRRGEGPRSRRALPATDGASIWLPKTLDAEDPVAGIERYRALALQQAMRAERRSAALLPATVSDAVREVYLLLEAYAADEALARLLPGVAGSLTGLRRAMLAARPRLAAFPPRLQPLETLLRRALAQECGRPDGTIPIAESPRAALALAQRLVAELMPDAGRGRVRTHLMSDLWLGELRAPEAPERAASVADGPEDGSNPPPRSARLPRRPQERKARPDEDDGRAGAWMVQTEHPHEQAEDPFGMQRPADRDEDTPADEFADALSELHEARLVATPGRPKEVLLSDDPPERRARRDAAPAADTDLPVHYPEWDYRTGTYRYPGATIRLLPPALGPQAWVDRTLEEHRAMLGAVRRRFEMLRARRVRLRKQLDGEEIDLDGWIESYADFRAGRPLAQALYQTQRPARRDLAIMLVIDVSGSTDGWISAHRRVIDVEREALLLVGIALDGMGEPYGIVAFSGEGPHAVTVRSIKRFDEPYGSSVAQRIAALEPEHYTRAGAAMRHATALLMQQPAAHRLLLLLSDGKPNDIDDYEGRYGVEDMRQAVIEAKLQGIFPFCLTIDRQAASYLPGVFGPHQYAMLPRPELLPTVLLDWMKRLVAA
ncbi:MAG TPA: VWA domain-containing protein [Burkholderiales bacterium]